ncbi:MAG: S9 family peptidase [Litorimonas sp.]
MIKRPNTPAPNPLKRPYIQSRFGHEWTDNYAWMKDDNWQEVMQAPQKLEANIRTHLETENTYTETALAPTNTLKDAIFEEMKARLEPEARGIPMPDEKFAYFHYFRKGDQHGIYARHDLSQSTPQDMTILDAEALSQASKAFFDIGDVSHSHNHHWLAYSVDLKGSENYAVYLRDLSLADDVDISTQITRSAGALVWATDNQTLFWVERDDNQRPYAVRYINLFDKTAAVQTAYEESDPGFFVSLAQSDDRAFIEISAHNHTTSEIWRIPSATPTAKPICFAPRLTGQEYSLHEHGGRSYILTNANGATDFAVMSASHDNTDRQHWQDFIAHKPGTLIIGMESFKNHLVRLERENALPRIVIRDMRSGQEHVIDMEEDAYSLGLVSGYEYDTAQIHFSYSSPTTPNTVFAYDMDTKERRIVKEQVVPSGHSSGDYRTDRITITGRDGAQIPVTLLRQKDTPKDGSAPLLLYGYGSYGITIPARFRTSILSLVDRGFVYAIAHIRGGMSKGYQWYLDGKLASKTNTFNDFVDTGIALVELGWTSKGKIVAHGGSAGGLLVGAAVNQMPELFGAVIAAVPFVDVLNTMSDAQLPLTPPEWPEWGNPIEDEQAFKRILSYSPYDNVTPQAYPPMLITAGLTDPRVTYWEPAKWTAKLRDHQTSDAPILFKVNMDAGHQGESGRYDSLKETALEYAFAITAVQ